MPVDPLHDAQIIGYEVDARQRRVVLHTAETIMLREVLVDVVFEYVIAYHLEQDDFENIIGEVREDDLANFVEREAARFAGAQKRGWPGDWSQGPESVLQFLRESQARAYGLESPFGLQGWVLARSVEFVRVKK